MTSIRRLCKYTHVREHYLPRWPPSRFAHLPLIMNSDGKKLSKRHDHLRVSSLRTSGYTPESLLTFLCSIGGGILPRNSYKEHAVYSSDSLVEAFYLENLTKGTGSLSFDLLNLYSRLVHDRNIFGSAVSPSRFDFGNCSALLPGMTSSLFLSNSTLR